MPLQNYQYDTIMREYSKTQSRNRRILEERTQEIYEKIPRIREIDEEVASLSAQKARALLGGESSSMDHKPSWLSLFRSARWLRSSLYQNSNQKKSVQSFLF